MLDQEKLRNTFDEAILSNSADLTPTVVNDNHSSSYSALPHGTADQIGTTQWHHEAQPTDDIQTHLPPSDEFDHLDEYDDNSQRQQVATSRDAQTNQAHQPQQRTKKMRFELALVTTNHANGDVPTAGASGHSTGSKRKPNSAPFISNHSGKQQQSQNLKLKQKQQTFTIDVSSDNESDASDEFTSRKNSLSVNKRLHRTKVPTTEEDDDIEEEDERLNCTLLTLEEILFGRQSHGK